MRNYETTTAAQALAMRGRTTTWAYMASDEALQGIIELAAKAGGEVADAARTARIELGSRRASASRRSMAEANIAAALAAGPIGRSATVYFAKGVVSAVVPPETVLVSAASDSKLIAYDSDLAPIAGWRVAQDGPEAFAEEMTRAEMEEAAAAAALRGARRPGQRSPVEQTFGVAGSAP